MCLREKNNYLGCIYNIATNHHFAVYIYTIIMAAVWDASCNEIFIPSFEMMY